MAAVATLPSLSQLLDWPTEHLTDAAAHWEVVDVLLADEDIEDVGALRVDQMPEWLNQLPSPPAGNRWTFPTNRRCRWRAWQFMGLAMNKGGRPPIPSACLATPDGLPSMMHCETLAAHCAICAPSTSRPKCSRCRRRAGWLRCVVAAPLASVTAAFGYSRVTMWRDLRKCTRAVSSCTAFSSMRHTSVD